MALNLLECDKACFGCIKGYGKKHSLNKGDSFQIKCSGIPKDYIPLKILESIQPSEREMAMAVYDPVTWAAQTLDWHCLDPDGEVWKRKNPAEYWAWYEANPGATILGKSRYHRPYQAEMLRCTAKRKVFRIGRQAGKTETLVVSMLFNMFNKPGIADDTGFEIIVITPFQAQIEVIFTRMIELIHSSPHTQNSLKRDVKAPIYTIELFNKSKIRGFTAGTKSGGNAASVRGQHGNMLVFDEADYLNAADMEAALSIITNYPNATVWMSSTPSGKREKFFETCHSKTWKEYHFPSTVNPLWSDELEADFREQHSDISYTHEILAEFGEQEQGVFQNVYVQAAKANYAYGSMAWNYLWTYTVGVDWNDTKNGTTINVLGFNPREQKFYVVDRHVVSREGWTQTSAINKIIEINRIWKPMAIYVDAGYGATQIEVLRAYGYECMSKPGYGPTHPDSKLPRIVKAYNFSSKVDTRDIFTKQPMQKAAKPFLVESTVRRFESNDIFFSKNDPSLEAQLLGYVIDRVTPTGVPVYRAGNELAGDHALDALMLSVVAFVLEVTPIGKPKFETHINFSGRLGEKNYIAEQGDLVISRDRKKDEVSKKDKIKPEMNRTEVLTQQSLFPNTMLPANHTKRETKVGLWANDEFMRDGPTPKIRTLGSIKRGGRVRSSPPRRKNI